MNKRWLPLILAFCFLSSFFPRIGFPKEIFLPPGKSSFPPEVLEKLGQAFPEEKSLAVDLKAIFAGYPGFCLGVEIRQCRYSRELYLIMKNRVKILYDDGVVKGFKQKLDKPDLKDMLDLLYLPGRRYETFVPDYDPGRFRVGAFFDTVYGASASEVKANLVPVTFCGARVMFNAQNGAAKALASVGGEMKALLAEYPKFQQYLFPLGGTFIWRTIAGTNRLSPHSWGIAIDLNPRHGAYWLGSNKRGSEVEKLRGNYPQEIVAIFEKHGFIWGGKWSHFDLMHFEYRPEMLWKWQLLREAATGADKDQSNEGKEKELGGI
jgi:hypothetical protein